MLTIKAEIKKSEQKSDKTYNVKLRFTLDRKVKRVSTSLFATPKDLTKDFKIKQNSPIKKDVDALIRVYQEKCAKLQIELNDYSVDDIVDMLNREQAKSQKIDFIKFCRARLGISCTIVNPLSQPEDRLHLENLKLNLRFRSVCTIFVLF